MPGLVSGIAEIDWCVEFILRKSSFAYFSFKKSRSGGAFLLKGSTNGICARGGIAGTDIYGLCRAGAVLRVIGAVGNIANNAVVAFASYLVIIFVHLLKLLSVSLFLFWHETELFIRA